ncbi:citrulline utilization hydrolase CtlX [Octadecabacter ascidiaceicola]|uniref:Amidinotransferase n=1 Tax=Octadecabacter ascidiaceicola TaxID=1655543 RepID=A0A238JL53_9RHOB|nr:arginine deiminase-related protein [Octadecabacter ascidiaceicola]SMX31123.1 hypothetical protein OCA8868_00201 [Octadecabacter ascidiaceicola]
MTLTNTLQAPRAVVMVRPHAFHPNAETAKDNSYQTVVTAAPDTVAAHALAEHDTAVCTLRKVGIDVHVFDDDGSHDTPDSVFPNNWFSTHPGGVVGVYPMYPVSRRRERRTDVLAFLKRDYRVETVYDYSGLEQDNLFLEGTGAMVLDHIGRIAMVARSNRADPIVLERFCTHFGYEPVVFDAFDPSGVPVYHTNVLMCIGTDFALIGLDLIPDEARRATVHRRLAETGRDVIALSAEQIANFAGNAIELTGTTGRYLALSARAANALTPEQTERITASATLLPLSLPTIECAGGSARCMIAGVHLTKRPKVSQ